MAKITECLIKPDAARVLKALTPHLKNAEGNLTFLCPRCKKPVQPIGDHFEHLSANPECPLTPEQRALHPAELGEPRKGNNASCRICEALNRVNAAMGKCRVCRTEIPAIGALGEREFVFDWLPFHSCNSECVKLIALTMEPANPGARQESDPVMSAFRPLKYALRRLLVRPGDGFMVTPIAKCSLDVSIATKTHGKRWDLCSPFLLQEIEALRKAELLCSNFFMVTVGDHPDGFLRKAPSVKEFSSRHLGKLTHYGAFRRGKFKIAPTDQEAFDQFLEEHEPEYRAFVKEHVWWDQDKLDRELKQDMQILFKWDRQMQPWRDRLR